TPALCASLLTPAHLRGNFLFDWFNRAWERTRSAYVHRVFQSVAHVPRWMIAFAVMVALGAFLLLKLPGSSLREQGQGYARVHVQLPAGATLPRTREVMLKVNSILGSNDSVRSIFIILVSSFTGNGENAARAFLRLKPWDERRQTAQEFIRWANAELKRQI